MTNGVLPTDVVINGRVFPDTHALTTSELNTRMQSHDTAPSRPVYYAQWAAHYAGTYTGPINGIVGPTSDLYNALVASYNQGYSGGGYTPPAAQQVSFAFFRDFFADWSNVDTNVYKVVS